MFADFRLTDSWNASAFSRTTNTRDGDGDNDDYDDDVMMMLLSPDNAYGWYRKFQE